MATDSEIIVTVRHAFASRPRPNHFTNHRHCDECADHDAVLCSRDLDTLLHTDVGNPGWDPICFTTPEGFAYYLPALVRLTLSDPTEPDDWYGIQLLFHLNDVGPNNPRIAVCTIEERGVIVQFLNHLVETRSQLVDRYRLTDDLFMALEYWSQE